MHIHCANLFEFSLDRSLRWTSAFVLWGIPWLSLREANEISDKSIFSSERIESDWMLGDLILRVHFARITICNLCPAVRMSLEIGEFSIALKFRDNCPSNKKQPFLESKSKTNLIHAWSRIVESAFLRMVSLRELNCWYHQKRRYERSAMWTMPMTAPFIISSLFFAVPLRWIYSRKW